MKNLNKIKFILFVFVLFYGAVFVTNSEYLDSETSQQNSFIAGQSSSFDIALNEIYANPVGGSAEEAALMPGGEWVELFNKGDWSIDLNGWYLYDAFDSHDLQITSGNVSGGYTIIPAKGRLVVYRNADPDFSLNNGAETVRLFDGIMGVGILIDTATYATTIEGHSRSRLPDGIGSWSDWHSPTPGGPNV